MTKFQINVISDPVCPFCYIGKSRLERAIALYQKTYPGGRNDTFTVTWSPYYLNNSAPKAGVPVTQRMAERFGADRVAEKQKRMRQMGAAEGFEFTFGGRIGHTRDAHRVMQLAKVKENAEVGNAVMASIMKAYFEGDADVTSWDDLIEAAARGGLDRRQVKQWLEEGKGGEEVDREVEEAERAGIRGVPQFVINGKYQVDGAQNVEDFVEQFVAAKAGVGFEGGESNGLMC
ncbi:hypothetical protein MMC10_004180 [Thelotrema lepadinum]|nr:hypothetical protein [Thelotrema lepadinum]